MYKGIYIYLFKCRLLVSRMLRWPWNLHLSPGALLGTDAGCGSPCKG